MMVVGLTGGIGSGKTTVAKEFQKLGVPVYIADEEAKGLMLTSEIIKEKLIELFGNEAYIEGRLNKTLIANKIFNDKEKLQKMNSIVHPEVAVHFENWKKNQTSDYVVKEVAILFETGGHKNCDFVITVTAPKDVKLDRLLKRDETSIEKIEAIMKNQWSDERRIELSDFVIENTDINKTVYQVIKIHNQILDKIR